MSKITDHPLTELLELYAEEYAAFRENNLDYPNVMFHRKFGLFLQTPAGWPVLEVIRHMILLSRSPTAIIFPSTDLYRTMHDLIGETDLNVEYFSWHEVFTGMQVAQTDIRHVHRIKSILSSAKFTFFIDPPLALPEVIDQVRTHSPGCLIVLSRGENID